jgi:hypothetical protein
LGKIPLGVNNHCDPGSGDRLVDLFFEAITPAYL